jgi:outer membrane protein
MIKTNLTSLLTRLALLTLVATLLGASAQAQQKIGVVDLKRLFEEYWKTKEADVQLKEDAAELEKQGQQMMEDFNKETETYKALLEAANDQALSVEERGRRKTTADAKLRELKQIEQEIALFQQRSRADLTRRQDTTRGRIIEEIKAVVRKHAEKGSFTIVFDKAAESANRTSVLLYANVKDELTEAVLKELNSTSPVDLIPGVEE